MSRTATKEEPAAAIPSMSSLSTSEKVQASIEQSKRAASLQVFRTTIFFIVGICVGWYNPVDMPVTNFMIAFTMANFMASGNGQWSDEEQANIGMVQIVLTIGTQLKDAMSDFCVYICAMFLVMSVSERI